MFSNSARKKVKYTRISFVTCYDVISRHSKLRHVFHISIAIMLYHSTFFHFCLRVLCSSQLHGLHCERTPLIYCIVMFIVLITKNYPLFIIFDESSLNSLLLTKQHVLVFEIALTNKVNYGLKMQMKKRYEQKDELHKL